MLLAWEGVNGILPHALQKMSILYYLQSLCPVPAPMDDDAPTLIRLLAAPAAPASRPGAILGLLLLTAFVLWIAGRAVRRMQISYGTENVSPHARSVHLLQVAGLWQIPVAIVGRISCAGITYSGKVSSQPRRASSSA